LQYWAQKKAQQANETLQFKLKAAEIALAARDSNQVKAKACILKELFGDELGQEFKPETFDPKTFHFSGGMDRREKLIALLAQYPSSRQEIIRAWGIVFPSDAVTGWNDLKEGDRERHRKEWFERLRNDDTLNRNIASESSPQ
jgi:hypothetical protein